VDLINFDNLVIFGPGSEWLWTMVSSVVLAVTFVAIYRQLRIQSRAAAVEQVQAAYRDWTSEGLTRAKQGILRAIEAGDTPEAMLPTVAGVANFWEAYGRLVRTRNIDGRLLRESFGHAVVLWWTLLADYVALVRERGENPGLLQDFEWLAKEFTWQDPDPSRPAVTPALLQAWARRQVPDVIAANDERLRMFEEMRSVSPAAGRRHRSIAGDVRASTK